MSRFITDPVKWFNSKSKTSQLKLTEKHYCITEDTEDREKYAESMLRQMSDFTKIHIWEKETGYKSMQTVESEHRQELKQLKDAYVIEKYQSQFK